MAADLADLGGDIDAGRGGDHVHDEDPRAARRPGRRRGDLRPPRPIGRDQVASWADRVATPATWANPTADREEARSLIPLPPAERRLLMFSQGVPPPPHKISAPTNGG